MDESTMQRVRDVVRHYWGFEELRPLQAEAIAAGIARRDSLVVMPTGGGKSLCYQVPPAVAERTDVVVSPLISLMKDQVDGLRQCGYPAAGLHSGRPLDVQRKIEAALLERRYRLLFVSPERLMRPDFLTLLDQLDVQAFAIDEAHCISHWGHDFRPEYRKLAHIKERFPNASVHAYTATATERVRDDITQQLGLRDPAILVGTFDRPNLTYRVVPRSDPGGQTLEIVRRHPDQAMIVYCITRAETEEVASFLELHGVRASCYHAGLDPDRRRSIQDAFSCEQLDVVVATVAFGMGIDRSDVRCVVHAAMPKSIEHYQQETGRAGRDGLEAECVLLYSPADAIRWEQLVSRSAKNADNPEDVIGAARKLLRYMRGLATSPICRHKLISEYFGQTYSRDNCAACDVCLGESVAGDNDSDALEIARKILSCVARVEQRFGIAHVAKVLTGANDRRLRQLRHDQLSTFGALSELDTKLVSNFIYQLVDQGVLDRTETDRPTLKLNAASREVLDGSRGVCLIRPRSRRVVKASKAEADGWGSVDRALFEKLRHVRRDLAGTRGVPPYVIFNDATLRALARQKPRTSDDLLSVPGIGPAKLAQFGDIFLEAICKHALAEE